MCHAQGSGPLGMFVSATIPTTSNYRRAEAEFRPPQLSRLRHKFPPKKHTPNIDQTKNFLYNNLRVHTPHAREPTMRFPPAEFQVFVFQVSSFSCFVFSPFPQFIIRRPPFSIQNSAFQKFPTPGESAKIMST